MYSRIPFEETLASMMVAQRHHYDLEYAQKLVDHWALQELVFDSAAPLLSRNGKSLKVQAMRISAVRERRSDEETYNAREVELCLMDGERRVPVYVEEHVLANIFSMSRDKLWIRNDYAGKKIELPSKMSRSHIDAENKYREELGLSGTGFKAALLNLIEGGLPSEAFITGLSHSGRKLLSPERLMSGELTPYDRYATTLAGFLDHSQGVSAKDLVTARLALPEDNEPRDIVPDLLLESVNLRPVPVSLQNLTEDLVALGVSATERIPIIGRQLRSHKNAPGAEIVMEAFSRAIADGATIEDITGLHHAKYLARDLKRPDLQSTLSEISSRALTLKAAAVPTTPTLSRHNGL